MKEPLISVIVPIYNVEKYLNQCVDSILGQTYQHIEVMLIDDGSPDNCYKICDNYELTDQRVKVIHKENGGLSDARNAGINACSGEYLLFIDSDDYYSTNRFIQNMVDLLNEKTDPIDIILFRIIDYYEDRNIFKADNRLIDKSLLKNKSNLEILEIFVQNDIFISSSCNKFIRKELIIDNNLLFKKGLLSEDIDWSGRLLSCLNSIDILNEAVYVYRRGRMNSITSTVGSKNIIDVLKTIDNAVQYSKCIKNAKKLKIYLSFFAFQYITLLVYINSVKEKNEKSDFLVRIRSLSFLLNYNLNRKVRSVQLMHQIFGLRITSLIMTAHFKRKNKFK